MNKFLLDTNILVHATDIDSAFNAEILTLLDSENQFFVTSKNLAEFIAVVTRFPKDNPLSLNDALKFVAQFQADFQVLFPDSETMEKFVDLMQRYQPVGLHIHDFEIAAIALKNQIRHVVTFNKKDFEKINEIQTIFPRDVF